MSNCLRSGNPFRGPLAREFARRGTVIPNLDTVVFIRGLLEIVVADTLLDAILPTPQTQLRTALEKLKERVGTEEHIRREIACPLNKVSRCPKEGFLTPQQVEQRLKNLGDIEALKIHRALEQHGLPFLGAGPVDASLSIYNEIIEVFYNCLEGEVNSAFDCKDLTKQRLPEPCTITRCLEEEEF